MAATTQVALPARTASPLALWHLLSLDAPTVAALWTWYIARANHIALPLAVPLAMALAVWIVYAADRLLDARNLHSSPHELEARHFYHHIHRDAFRIAIGLASLALAVLLPSLALAAIRLYLLEGALLLAWLLVLHTTHLANRLPKEIAVGVFFSAAVFIPTVARNPSLRPLLLPSAMLFAFLCSLNCLFLYAWEHEEAMQPSLHPAHITTRLAVAHLPTLAIVFIVSAATLTLVAAAPTRAVAAACALAALLLLFLHRNRRQLSRTHLRAAADFALLTPALVLPFLR